MSMRREHRSGGVGPFGAIRERPLLFLVLLGLFLSSGLFAVSHLKGSPPPSEVSLRTDIITLDMEAETPNSLVRSDTIDRRDLLDLISAAASSNDPTPIGMDDVVIADGSRNGDFILVPSEKSAATADEMNALALQIVDVLNHRRSTLKDQALAWGDETEAAWRSRIDRAKAAIVKNPFDPELPGADGLHSDDKLLRLMIDATASADAEASDGGEPSREVVRLTALLNEREAGRAAQLRHGTALRDAEAGLAQHREQIVALLAEGGVFDRPAASVIEPASPPEPRPLTFVRQTDWPLLLSSAAALSTVLALTITMIVCWMKPKIDIAADDYLNNPNWPLPPNARRTL